jgi:hypothetical protein
MEGFHFHCNWSMPEAFRFGNSGIEPTLVGTSASHHGKMVCPKWYVHPFRSFWNHKILVCSIELFETCSNKSKYKWALFRVCANMHIYIHINYVISVNNRADTNYRKFLIESTCSDYIFEDIFTLYPVSIS